MVSFRIKFATRLSILVSCLLSPFPLQAQEISSPSDEDKKGPLAHVRVWMMVFNENAPLAVKSQSAGGEPMTIFEGDGKTPSKSSYLEIPHGSTTLSLTTGASPVKSEKIDFKPDDYRTILISRKNGALSWEIFQDPIPGQKDFPPAVRLLNFGTERTADITIGTQPPVKVQPNTCLVTPLLASGEINIAVSLPDPMGGPAATSVTDLNTSISPSWSVIMIPDYRGKLRPRVSPDGKE